MQNVFYISVALCIHVVLISKLYSYFLQLLNNTYMWDTSYARFDNTYWNYQFNGKWQNNPRRSTVRFKFDIWQVILPHVFKTTFYLRRKLIIEMIAVALLVEFLLQPWLLGPFCVILSLSRFPSWKRSSDWGTSPDFISVVHSLNLISLKAKLIYNNPRQQ